MVVIERSHLDSVAKEYLSRLKTYGEKHKNNAVGKILKTLSDDEFNSLILCPPEELKTIPVPKDSNRFLTAYKSFFAETGEDNLNNAIWLMRKLNVKVCPYCNRTYTFTLQKKTIEAKRYVRPEIDHFFPKSKYKHLALSFYNLVPSCPLCNQLKGNNEFKFHPYYGNLDGNDCPRIEVENVKKNANGLMLFPDDPKVKICYETRDTQTLGLQELYEQHTDYVKEILDKIQAYNKDYYDPLVTSFQGMGKTQEEIDRLVWGNYVEEASPGKRPLSKMTCDILKQFDVI